MSSDGAEKSGIPQLLLAALEERGWSYRELADRAGVSTAAVGGHVTGQYKPRAETLRKYATALGLPARHLLVLAGYLPPGRDDRPLELDALHEKLDDVWSELSRESQINLSRYILGLEPYKPPSERR